MLRVKIARTTVAPEKQENTLNKLQSQDFPILFQITHTRNKNELYQTKREIRKNYIRPKESITHCLQNHLASLPINFITFSIYSMIYKRTNEHP